MTRETVRRFPARSRAVARIVSRAWRLCRSSVRAFGLKRTVTRREPAVSMVAVFVAVRPDRPKEGVPVVWGFTEAGERVLLSVMLGESHEHWLEPGRDLIARGNADADRRRRRPRADQGHRALLAGIGPPALCRLWRQRRRNPTMQPIGPEGHEKVTLFVERDGRLHDDALVTAAHFVPLIGEHGFDER